MEHIPLSVLKKRREFLRLRSGPRFACPEFTLQTLPRSDDDPTLRFGLTVTKREGNAVTRNRIKRRLREALRHLQRDSRLPFALKGNDLVVIGRADLASLPFATLVSTLADGLERLVAKPGPKGQKRRDRSKMADNQH